MKKIFLLCSFSLFFAVGSLHSIISDGLIGSSRPAEPKILINNRILAKVNGKSITTYDVMKKMDITFYKEFPEYVASTEARFQFYQHNWKHELEEMIMKELILADAQESKVEVSGGDLRQEMESMFGPNIIANLDKVGLTYDEASKIVEGDILISRMIGGRVNAKALREVTPAKIQQTYNDYISDPKNIESHRWKYRVITIKERTLERTENGAKSAYELLKNGTPLTDLAAKMKEDLTLGRQGKVTISDPIENNEVELSPTYKDVLVTLSKGSYSEPFSAKSRTDNATVYRILFLEDKITGKVPSYKEMEPKIKEYLINLASDKETKVYIDKLKHHFHLRDSDVEAMVPADYEPFTLN